MNKYKKSSLLLCGILTAVTLILSGCGQKPESEEADSGPSEATLSGSPEVAIQSVINAIGDKQGGVLWQAMPSSYQNDLNAIAQLAGTKVDAEIYNKIFSTVDRLVTVADKQKDFIFNTEIMGGPMPEEEKAKLQEGWPSIVSLFSTITKSSISSAEELQSFDGQAFFSNAVSSILSDMDALTALNPESEEISVADLASATVSLLEKTETTAKLQINLPGDESEEEMFVKVGERWVPQQLSLDWETNIANARAQLEAIDPTAIAEQKPQLMNIFAMIDGVLGQIEAAETQAQFDQALQGAMMPIMGLMMMGQGMGGGGMAPGPDMQMMPEMPAEPEMPSAPVEME